MCGINGFVGEDREKITAMNNSIKSRGPDANGFFVSDGFSLGHVRLSIIDTSDSANQPMVSEDEDLIIVFNGEIYNFQELKEELKEEYNFKTNSDTEVILAGYKKWKTDLFEKLNGIFAFSIFDKKNEEVILVRDRMGIKPLFYYYNKEDREKEEFVFSSEIKGILEYGIKPILNFTAFDSYMRLLFTSGEETMFGGIKRLKPGSYLKLKNNSKELEFEIKQYFSFDKKINRRSVSRKEVESTIDEAVKRQLISDRPLGIYLSGGFDSTIILDSVIKANKNSEVDTFSIGFDLEENEERDKFNKDFNLAQKTADFYKTNHSGFLIKKDEVLPAFKKSIFHLGEPISNPTTIPMILLSERVKDKGIDVVLGGDGGDELFGGYKRYVWAFRRDLYQNIIPVFIRDIFKKVHPKFSKLDDRESINKYGRFMFQKEDLIKKVMGENYRNGDGFKESFSERFISDLKESKLNTEESMKIDRETWLTNESLIRSDTLSMANGLEARVPFLDNEVISLSDKISIFKKVGLFDAKKILKYSFKKRLPKYLYNQPKRGWFSPGAKWLRDPEIKKFAKNVLSVGYHNETDKLFDWEEVNDMFNKHISGEKYNFVMLWAIINFRVWAKTFNVSVK